MRLFLLTALCLALSAPCLAQNADTDPATKDDLILYFRTMHSFDMMQKMMEVQSKSMQQLMHDQFAKDGQVPADFDARMQKMMGSLIKDMPADEMTQATIPAYQRHFTRGDIAALNAFYSSPVGQKVLQELPVVTQEGMQEMMPILSKYLSEWREKVDREFKENPPAKTTIEPAKN
jgi:hypothetical protein